MLEPSPLKKLYQRLHRRTRFEARRALEAVRTPPEPRRPVLGIVGFFGHGNYGDELFLSVFEQYFGADFDLMIIPDLTDEPYFSGPIAHRVARADAILIGGGDLIRPWALDERYFNLAYLRKPVYMVGLGVPIRVVMEENPHVPKRYRRFFRHPNVKFVGVRDEESRAWVEQTIAPTAPLVSAPDIVCALALPDVPQPRQDKVLGIVTRLRPDQETPDDYSRLQALATTLQGRGWSIRQIILGTGIVGERDLANASDLNVPGKELVVSENLDDLSRAIGECATLASMKFHGTVVATMYGVPSIVLIPTSKNRSFMQRIGREDLISTFEATDLAEKFTPAPPPLDATAVAALRTRAAAHLVDLNERIKRDVIPVVAAGEKAARLHG
jgi:polysaccharide pyruvyl transferase WcaK-like protein